MKEKEEEKKGRRRRKRTSLNPFAPSLFFAWSTAWNGETERFKNARKSPTCSRVAFMVAKEEGGVEWSDVRFRFLLFCHTSSHFFFFFFVLVCQGPRGSFPPLSFPPSVCCKERKTTMESDHPSDARTIWKRHFQVWQIWLLLT